MWQKVAFVMVLLMATISVASGQMSSKTDARSLLVELGAMLKEIPESTQQCQELLKRIKAWQEQNLKELEKPKLLISITEPKDGDAVPELPNVKGTVSDPNARVWVVIHPMKQSEFWVQQSITVQDSTWEVTVHIGQGTLGVGERFEIRAVANPKEEIGERDVLPGWPDAQSQSRVIKVTRR
jgi:hypothetical protein